MDLTTLIMTALTLTVQPAGGAAPVGDADRVIQSVLDQQFSTQTLCVRPPIRRVTLSDQRFHDDTVQSLDGILLPRRSPAQISADRLQHYEQLWFRARPGGYDDNETDVSLDSAEAVQLAIALETLILQPNGTLSVEDVHADAIRPPLKMFDGQENCTVLSFAAPEIAGEFAFIGVGLDCHEATSCWRYLLFALRRQGSGWRTMAYRIDWSRD